ncbi:MAG TPA: hypothetical protein VK607_12315 [Kofleriaceae bacterium]|nr:hypothetical protein [Kofleriaceae bacterium]
MSFRSIFVFDGGSTWARDWSQYDFVDHRPGLGDFTRLDLPMDGAMPRGRYHGARNTLTVAREDNEELVDLYQMLNMPPLGGPGSAIYQRLTQEAENASHQLPPLVNVLFRNPITFSYSLGARAVGPGNEHGGLRSIPDRYKDQLLLTIKVPLHINTPPGMSSIDAELVFYVGLHIDDRRVAPELVGAAHPWRFHGDGYGAYQNEINQGLERAAQRSLTELQPVVDVFRAHRASHVYLLPGAAHRRLEDDAPLRDSATSRMTLALVP